MEESKKALKVIKSPLVQGITGWITLFTTMVIIAKYGYSLMTNYPIYFISFFITGFLVMPTVYIIHTYYFQKKENSDNTCRMILALSEIENNINYKTANIYCNFAFTNHGNPVNSLIYYIMALDEYIEIEDQRMIRQVLYKIIPVMKNIAPGSLPAEDISHLNETISKIDQEVFKTEIGQIKELIKAIT